MICAVHGYQLDNPQDAFAIAIATHMPHSERRRLTVESRRQPAPRLPDRSHAQPDEEAAPAPRLPGQPSLGRQRAQVISLGRGGGVAVDLDLVVVEVSDLVLAHADA